MKSPIYLVVTVTTLFVLAAVSLPAQDDNAPKLTGQLQERRIAYRNALRKVVDVMQMSYQEGTISIDGLLKSQVALVDAELAVTSDPNERVKKLDENMKRLSQAEAFARRKFESGAAGASEMHKSVAARIHGEIMLLEERIRQQKH